MRQDPTLMNVSPSWWETAWSFACCLGQSSTAGMTQGASTAATALLSILAPLSQGEKKTLNAAPHWVGFSGINEKTDLVLIALLTCEHNNVENALNMRKLCKSRRLCRSFSGYSYKLGAQLFLCFLYYYVWFFFLLPFSGGHKACRNCVAKVGIKLKLLHNQA